MLTILVCTVRLAEEIFNRGKERLRDTQHAECIDIVDVLHVLDRYVHDGVSARDTAVVDQQLDALCTDQLPYAGSLGGDGLVVRQVEEEGFVVVAQFFLEPQGVFLFADAPEYFETSLGQFPRGGKSYAGTYSRDDCVFHHGGLMLVFRLNDAPDYSRVGLTP